MQHCNPLVFFSNCPYNTYIKFLFTRCGDISYRYRVSGLSKMLPNKRPAIRIQRFKILAFLGLLELHIQDNKNADNKRLN
jgi:hypothetical protein